MKYIKFIIYLFIGLISIVIPNRLNAQIKQSNLTWEEIRNELNKGNVEYFYYLEDCKNNLESLDKWDNQILNTYQSIVRLMSQFTSRNKYYKEQEKILKEAKDILDIKDSDKNSEFKRDLNVSLTELYYNLNDIDTQIKIGRETIELFKKANDLGIGFISLLLNLANGALKINDLENTELFINEACNRLKILIKEKEDNITILNNLLCHLYNLQGRVELRKGNFKQAEDYFLMCIENAKSNGLTSIEYLAQNNLATVYFAENKIDSALPIFEGLKKLRPSPELFTNLLIIRALKSYNEQVTFEELEAYNNLRYKQTLNIQNSLSEEEFELFLEGFIKQMYGNNNLIASKYSNTIIEAYNANLFCRSMNLARKYALNKELANNDNLKRDFNNLRGQRYSKYLTAEQRDSISNLFLDLEDSIIQNSQDFLNQEINYVGDWSTIVNNLEDHDISLMFCFIPNTNSQNLSPSSNYGVYIVSKDYANPILLNLCSVDEIEDIFYNDSTDEAFISDLYSGAKNKRIYEKLIKPIESYLKDKINIYYSLTGTLLLLNIEALNDGEMTLNERYKMHLCSSPTRIFDIKNNNFKSTSIALFGSPKFNMTHEEILANSERFQNCWDISLPSSPDLALLRSGWGDLPGTKIEIEKIYNLFSNHNISAFKYIDSEACEEQFKKMDGESPSIIHIATHGFNLNTEEKIENAKFLDQINAYGDTEFLRKMSGIILSGGNLIWQGKKKLDSTEDGIVSSEEISRLDLSNTELVVISACESALGWIDPIEGVLGLQRAFKEAGVKTILMTLWKVPDNTTAMFMTEFYRNLIDGDSVRDAVQKAKKYLIDNGASDPYYWAPFVVLD